MQTVSRINITVPTNLLWEIDNNLSPRQRSQFFTESASRAVQSLKKTKKKKTYYEFVKNLGEVFSLEKHPEWKDLNSVVKWVNEGRKQANRDYSYIPRSHVPK